VPRSRYPELAARAREAVDRRGLTGYIFGHAGDGNLHCLILGPEGAAPVWEQIQDANQEIVEAALTLGGTATGEHGVGLGKRKFLVREHGAGVDLMRQLKQSLDPKGILNPGKVLP
jgi:D-lactate dehydrogenase (cytochrome)